MLMVNDTSLSPIIRDLQVDINFRFGLMFINFDTIESFSAARKHTITYNKHTCSSHSSRPLDSHK